MADGRFQPGVIVSGLAHAAVLGWAVVSIAAPAPLQVDDVEALPIEIVPIEEITRSVAGEKTAPPSPTPAPTPTKAPPRPEPAENAGETKEDIKADAPKEAPTPPVEKIETATAPTVRPPEPKPDPVPEPVVEEAPTPPTPEPVARPEPTPEPKPEPVQKTDLAALAEQAEAETKAEETPDESLKLPDKVAAPQRRPTPPKPEPAKPAAAKPQTAKEKAPAKETKTALLNKAQPSAGGAKRSEKKASQGVKKANSAAKLSASEIDALRGQIQACWNVGALTGSDDAEKLRAKVVFRLARDGSIEGRPDASATGSDARTNRTFAGGARRAVQRCAPYKLPADKYETWADVTVNFSLADML